MKSVILSILSFLFAGGLLIQVPGQPTTDAYLLTEIADHEARIAFLEDQWRTQDAGEISTLVATFTATGTHAPTQAWTATVPPTNTPNVPATPTPEGESGLTATALTDVPTFQASATPSPIIAAPTITLTPTGLPVQVVASNVSGSPLNIRLTCTTSAEIIGQVARQDNLDTPYRDDQVVIDLSRPFEYRDNHGWVWLWNGSGCVAMERIAPYAMYLNWSR